MTQILNVLVYSSLLKFVVLLIKELPNEAEASKGFKHLKDRHRSNI